jgi:hypothetical protein
MDLTRLRRSIAPRWARSAESSPPAGRRHALPEHPRHITLGGGATTSTTPNAIGKFFMALPSRLRGEEAKPQGRAAGLSFTARIDRAISLLFTRIQRGGWCGLHCAHRATTALSWGLCEHRDHVSCLAPPFRACRPSLLEGGLFGLPLRASNEGLRRPRVARAQETNRLPSLPSIRRTS